MIKLYNIPTIEQLKNISRLISDELKDIRKDNMCVIFSLNKNLVRQIDEELFFKNNKDVELNDFVESDEVEVLIDGIKFKFINDDQ